MKGDNDNEYDNKAIIARIAKLRVERSHLLGYDSYADFVLERTMAKTPEKVFSFLAQVWDAATPVAKAEAAAQQEMIDKEGGKFKLAPWDWWYYSEKIKKAKYDLDDEVTRPYFKIDNVMEGMFYVANQLYGLEFTKRTDIPKYHPDVNTFEVTRNGKHVGILMIDNYPRLSEGPRSLSDETVPAFTTKRSSRRQTYGTCLWPERTSRTPARWRHSIASPAS